LAHHKSAIKRIRTSENARVRNRANRSALRTVVRKLEKADAKTLPTVSKEVASVADHMARKGIIHKNKAARLKSQAQKKAAKAAKA